jgi:hypothetical protein
VTKKSTEVVDGNGKTWEVSKWALRRKQEA